MKRIIIILALVAIVALPFILRSKQRPSERADETLVIVTPHNEAIRHEFALGFQDWYRSRTGKKAAIDWRVLGGTSEIARYLDGEYIASFQNYWTHKLGKPWSLEVQAGFQNGRLPADAPASVKEARAAFLQSEVGCGIDIFFGGGSFDFEQQAAAGRIVASEVVRRHPEWFGDSVIPESFDGGSYRDPKNRWFGCVISSYGIICNRDALRRLGFERPPGQWADLADPRFFGEVALCDPTKSGSIAAAFENVIQQQMQERLRSLEGGGGDPKLIEARAVNEGWIAGLQLLQRIGANARYFTDTSQKPPIDVADGNCAAGMCIDFYGRQQQEAVSRRGVSDRLEFVSPPGGTSYSVDPIALLRGADHRELAEAFIEYALSMDGQKLWNFKPGSPGGPREFALRRLPVRKDFYEHAEWLALRSDPAAAPYSEPDQLVYRPQWTGRLFRELAFIIRVMCQDVHTDLVRTWRAVIAAPEPARSRALAAMQDLSFVDYARAGSEIKRALGSRDRVDEIRMANELAARFRSQYAKAEALAAAAP